MCHIPISSIVESTDSGNHELSWPWVASCGWLKIKASAKLGKVHCVDTKIVELHLILPTVKSFIQFDQTSSLRQMSFQPLGKSQCRFY